MVKMKLKKQKTINKKFKRSAKQIREEGTSIRHSLFPPKLQNYTFVDSTLIAN